MARRLPILALSLAIVLAGGATAVAQAPQGDADAPRLVASGWTVNCRPAEQAQEVACEASQSIALENTRRAVLTVFVTPWRGEDAGFGELLRFQLPHGIDIPAGLTLAVDGKAMDAPTIQTSSPAGLFARIGLTAPLRDALKAGATMTLGATALNGNTLAIPVPLIGFTAIFSKLQ